MRCEQVACLLSVVVNLKEKVQRLRSIRKCKQEIDCWSNTVELARKTLGWYPPVVVDPLPCCCWVEGDNLREEEDWKWDPAQNHRQPPSWPTSVPQVPLHNRFEALELEGEVSEVAVGGPPLRLPRMRQSAPYLETASAKKDRRAIVVGNSLLRGMEVPAQRELCCLLGEGFFYETS